jgi:3-phenylpropionate/trans-cinnamate dioxygenase ferredoxin reductase subunit
VIHNGPAPRRIVVVGAGLAGATAAATLRDRGFDGELTLVGEEARPPYERPPLSKAFLRGEVPFDDTLVRPPGHYAERGIRLRLGSAVTAIDADRRDARLADGERLPYDRLLLATGARTRRPPIPGLDLGGVHQLRTVEDAERIRAEAAPGRHAVVAGMGFIGCEVAASLRTMGLEVTAIDSGAVPLERVLGRDVGAALASLHLDHGVRTIHGDRVEAFHGSRRVGRVSTARGRMVDCDLVVAGVGAVPNSELASAAGVAVSDGIDVDGTFRSSAPEVFAVGDVANHLHPGFGRIRVEHWRNAAAQGRAAAAAILGDASPYAEVPWFYSDQYGRRLEYAGYHRTWDRLVVRGDLAAGRFLAFYLIDGAPWAVVGLDRGADVRRATGLVAARRPVDPSLLADEEVDLRVLASGG